MFERYKKEQGKWTRGLTLAGGLLIVVLGARWLYESPLTSIGNALNLGGYTEPFKIGLAALFALIGGYVAFWASYLNPGTGDFFIATEGEMKKVSWSSRREILGSTWVVIVTLIVLGGILFVVDLQFMRLFSAVGVLRVATVEDLTGGTGQMEMILYRVLTVFADVLTLAVVVGLAAWLVRRMQKRLRRGGI